MKAFTETRSCVSDPVFEDAESGLDVEGMTMDHTQDSNMAREASMCNGIVIYKPILPKGSTTFQQVIDEIKREKEAEKALIQKTLDAFATAKKKPKVKNDNRNVNTNRWRLMTMRARSQLN